MDYFLDTFALIEIVKGNENYQKYLDKEFITTKYNLAELHYSLLARLDLKTADFYLKKFSVYAIDFDIAVISEAMVFRKDKTNSKNRISYIDCIGYMIAKKNSVKFLTGDKQFKDMDNVEFVK